MIAKRHGVEAISTSMFQEYDMCFAGELFRYECEVGMRARVISPILNLACVAIARYVQIEYASFNLSWIFLVWCVRQMQTRLHQQWPPRIRSLRNQIRSAGAEKAQ